MNLGNLAMLTPYAIGILAAVAIIFAGVGSTLVETIMTAAVVSLLTTYAVGQGVTTIAIRLDQRQGENT